MRTFISRTLLGLGLVLMISGGLPSCASSKHCPAVAGTGNSATRVKGFGRGGSCPAVKGTGNYKPKVRKKKEDGLISKDMAKAMAKAEKKKTSPIKKRKLSFDQ